MSNPSISLPEPLMARLFVHCHEEGLTVEQCIEGWLDLEEDEEEEGSSPQEVAVDGIEASPAIYRRVRVKKTELMAKAIELAKEVPVGESFSLGTLLGKERWNLPSPKAFGRVFKSELAKKGIAKQSGRDHSARVAKYIRIESQSS